MLRSLYTAVTGMQAQEMQMNVISNNLANSNTTGFKKERADFQDLLYDVYATGSAAEQNAAGKPSSIEVGMGVKVGSTMRSFSQGSLLTTNNPLDIAINGSGFFQIQKNDGSIQYTRSGNFTVDSQRRIVNQEGYPVEPTITIPENAIEVQIKEDGRVFAAIGRLDNIQEIGQMQLALFPNEGGLQAVGGNLFSATPASGNAQIVTPGELEGAGALKQGVLEGSNVQAVEEMIGLITTQRAYEMNSKVIQSADQMLQKLTNLR